MAGALVMDPLCTNGALAFRRLREQDGPMAQETVALDSIDTRLLRRLVDDGRISDVEVDVERRGGDLDQVGMAGDRGAVHYAGQFTMRKRVSGMPWAVAA